MKNVGQRLTVQPHICGYICICCGVCSSDNLDAIDYYSNEEDRLKAEVSKYHANKAATSVNTVL